MTTADSRWAEYKVDVPEGVCGAWRVERFTVTAPDLTIHNLRQARRPRPRPIIPGTYTRLVCTERGWRQAVMSDTPAEVQDHWEMICRARGRILINGLGLGVVLQACLWKPEVTHATVIELAPEVIALVAPHYQARFGDRLEIIRADAFTWTPPPAVRYAAVWHDVWPAICADNLPEMARLHRRYGRRCDWQGSWGRSDCAQQRRQG